VAHHGRNHALLLRRRFREAALCKLDRGQQRAAPRPKVFPGEFFAHIDLDVVVQPLRRQVVEVAFPLVAEESPAALEREQLLHRGGELGIDDLRAHQRLVLAAKAEDEPASTNRYVTLV
jgi:hypothetical protein